MIEAEQLWNLMSEEQLRGLERRSIEVAAGVTLHVVVRAEPGDPIILLHGIWGWWGYWRALLGRTPDVFAGRPLMLVDLRGHGASDKPAGGYALDDYAADIEAVVQSLPDTPVSLVGHSLGALTSLLVAGKLPERIRSIVLEDPPLPAPRGGVDAFRGVYELKQEPLDAIIEQLFLWNPEMSSASARESATCMKATADAVFTATFDPQHLAPEIPTPGVVLHCPALVLPAGNPERRALRPGGLDMLRGVCPRLEEVVIPGTSHTVLRDAPDAYAERLTAFFAGEG